MSADDFASLLQAAVRRHIGPPGTIHGLQRLTGGAVKTTWSFDADLRGALRPLILQLSSEGATDQPNPIAEISPHLTADEDAHLMIAAVKAGVPAPRVRAILQPDDALGPGYVTERVAGETLGPRIVRDDEFARARSAMTAQCAKIMAAIHAIDLKAVPFLKAQDPAQMVAAQRKVVDYYNFRLPALELGLKWSAENAPKNPRHTVVHGEDPMQDLGWICVKTWRFGGRHPVGGFGKREELFASYERASGYPVDPAHVRFWEAFGSVKWAVGCLRLGMRGVEEVGIERSAIGRRIEEPLWDFLNLIEGRD
jgi:aminoglycoside phosphotransferase (APT) family kinase protein